MAFDPDKLELAREQLARVQVAALDPVDWSDLALYVFYALENAASQRPTASGSHGAGATRARSRPPGSFMSSMGSQMLPICSWS